MDPSGVEVLIQGGHPGGFIVKTQDLQLGSRLLLLLLYFICRSSFCSLSLLCGRWYEALCGFTLSNITCNVGFESWDPLHMLCHTVSSSHAAAAVSHIVCTR